MSPKAEGLNPKLLSWARESAGLSVDEVAERLNKDPKILEAWELGADLPTYVQLEKLAYEIYRRPLALFFFPEAPDEPEPRNSFRTLPDFEIEEISPVVRLRIREARALQFSLYELTGGRNPAERLIFRDISAKPNSSPGRVAERVRKYLNVSVIRQTKEWKTADEAMKGWRASLEDAGVFVFKEAFKQDDVSGFCLYDAEFPLICVNNSMPKTRQIFTFFHELGHILLSVSGIAKIHDTFIAGLHGDDRRIEIFCNQFAADVLFPDTSFAAVLSKGSPREETFVTQIADEFKVSRETVLRRFLDAGAIDREYYEEMSSQWRQQIGDARGSGGNYYRTQAAYLGPSYLQLAFRRFYEGKITLEELASYLNVKPKNVMGFEDLALQASG